MLDLDGKEPEFKSQLKINEMLEKEEKRTYEKEKENVLFTNMKINTVDSQGKMKQKEKTFTSKRWNREIMNEKQEISN